MGSLNQYGATAAAINLLNSSITSATAVAAGIPIPYPNFTNSTIQHSQSVAQALRPFPQYLTVDTSQSGGDKSGHSSYNAVVLKLNRRFSGGLTMQWSYTFSKILTDSDTYYANAGFAEDQGNRKLEKSIGAYDQTHSVRPPSTSVRAAPSAVRRRQLAHERRHHQRSFGWMASERDSSLCKRLSHRSDPQRAAAYLQRHQPPLHHHLQLDVHLERRGFDPAIDHYLSCRRFPRPAELHSRGNATRFNPLVRGFAPLNENISLGKAFAITERFRLDFRVEAFNLLNRVVFSNPTTNLNSSSFGLVTGQSNSGRQMQMALKLYW